jgi:hypothetical protein
MFPAGFTRSRWAIFLLCKYFKPTTTSLAQVGNKSANEASLRNGQNFLEYKDFLQLQTVENRSKNTPSLLKIQGTGLCSCVLLYCSTVRLLSRNPLDIIVFGNHFFWSFLCILLGIRTQTYRNPTYFLFRKVSTQTLATLDPFLPFFSDLLG